MPWSNKLDVKLWQIRCPNASKLFKRSELLRKNHLVMKVMKRCLENDKINPWPLNPRKTSEKHGDFNNEASFYSRKTELLHGDKLFRYRELLCSSILQKEFKFKISNVDRNYDGFIDPFDHIANYQTVMHLQGARNEVLCCAFALTFEKWAHIWYHNLS